MTKELYILSGLGADERVLQSLDFSGFSVTFVQWITPHNNESIAGYATRLLGQIPAQKPVLIGLSFGGMVAVELAKQIDTEKIILIASAKTRKEIPFYYRLAGKLKVHTLLPKRGLKRSNFLVNWLFGAHSRSDKNCLAEIFHTTDPTFFKWAINAILTWKNETEHENLFHIHGTKDKILPLRFVKCEATIKGGGHLMTLNQSDEVSRAIRYALI